MPPQHQSSRVDTRVDTSPPLSPASHRMDQPGPHHIPPPFHRKTWSHLSAPELPLYYLQSPERPWSTVNSLHVTKHQRPPRPRITLTNLCTSFLAKFVLEVLGGAGAIWGSSEVLALRTPENSATIFRPLAAAVGGVFFLRWCLELSTAIQEVHLSARYKRDSNAENDLESLTLEENNCGKQTGVGTPIDVFVPKTLMIAPTVSMQDSVEDELDGKDRIITEVTNQE